MYFLCRCLGPSVFSLSLRSVGRFDFIEIIGWCVDIDPLLLAPPVGLSESPVVESTFSCSMTIVFCVRTMFCCTDVAAVLAAPAWQVRPPLAISRSKLCCLAPHPIHTKIYFFIYLLHRFFWVVPVSRIECLWGCAHKQDSYTRGIGMTRFVSCCYRCCWHAIGTFVGIQAHTSRSNKC